jgi:hypothetical protein
MLHDYKPSSALGLLLVQICAIIHPLGYFFIQPLGEPCSHNKNSNTGFGHNFLTKGSLFLLAPIW